MKSSLNYIAPLFLLLIGISVSSCEKELIANPDQYTRVYMPQATEQPKVHDLIMTDAPQSIVFGAAIGGVNDQSSTLNVKFKVETDSVASYNARHNTNYQILPAAAYELSGTEATIASGQTSSNALKLNVKTVGFLEPLREYLLPISIAEVSPSVTVNDSLRTTYIKIKGTYLDFDRSTWQVTGVSSEESPNIGSNVLDGNTASNWHTQWRAAKPAHPHWITVYMNEPKMVHGFFFWPASTGNGNPANITIDLSMDGTNWEHAGDFTLVNTFVRQVVYLDSTKEAMYFRVTIKTSTGNTHFTHPAEIGAF